MSHYTLYIDDTGSREPDHTPLQRDDGMNCFGLGGILVSENDIEPIVAQHKVFCARWNITYPLHSTEIRGKRGNFRWLNDDVKKTGAFHDELKRFMANIPVIGIAAVVDRDGYNVRYAEMYNKDRWRLCKTAYTILLERAAKFCKTQGATMGVKFEQCGIKEEREMRSYHKTLRINGHPFDPERSAKYDALSPLDYRLIVKGDPRRGTKKDIFLQIADIYLYSMAKHGYDPLHEPWLMLMAAGRIVDSIVGEEGSACLGVKYSCFDESKKQKT